MVRDNFQDGIWSRNGWFGDLNLTKFNHLNDRIKGPNPLSMPCVFSIRTVVATRETDENRDIVSDIVKGRKSDFISTDYLL